MFFFLVERNNYNNYLIYLERVIHFMYFAYMKYHASIAIYIICFDQDHIELLSLVRRTKVLV